MPIWLPNWFLCWFQSDYSIFFWYFQCFAQRILLLLQENQPKVDSFILSREECLLCSSYSRALAGDFPYFCWTYQFWKTQIDYLYHLCTYELLACYFFQYGTMYFLLPLSLKGCYWTSIYLMTKVLLLYFCFYFLKFVADLVIKINYFFVSQVKLFLKIIIFGL